MTERLLSAENSLTDGKARAIDLSVGGQQGAKRDNSNWISTTLYTKQKLIPALLRSPGGFRFMPDSAKRIAILKSIMEIHSISITGLNSSLTVETGDSLVNNSGEVFQTVIKVSRERSNPIHSVMEVKGKPVTTFVKQWIQELLQDPESGHPGIIGRPEYIAAGSPDLLADDVSAAMLYYEPNVERTGVTGTSYMCTNMFPLSITDEAQRVIGAPNETMQVDIPFSSLTIVGRGVDILAKAHLDSLNKEAMAVNALSLAQEEIMADVAAATTGYAEGADAVANALTDQ